MRICFFCHISGLGGAERSLLQLVGDLTAQHGVRCTVVCPNEGPLVARLRALGADVDVVPHRWWVGGPADEAEWAQRLEPSAETVVAYVYDRLRDAPPDIVVSHSIVTPWGAVAAALLRRPHAWHVCEIPGGDFNFPFANDDQALIDDIVATSSHLFMAGPLIRTERLRGLPADQVTMLPRYIEIPPPEAAYVSPFDDPGSLRIGLFSSYNPRKGHMDAIRAVHLLIEQGRRVELFCAGPVGSRRVYDQLTNYLEANDLGARIRLSDYLPNPYDAMRACDIVLAVGQREAFGRTALEGMLLGKAVVYADDGMRIWYMQDGVNGLAYCPGDHIGLAAQLNRLGDDPDLRRQLGSRARDFAADSFTRDNYTGRFFRACSDLLAAAAPARPMPRHIASVVETALARNLASLTAQEAISRAGR